MWYFDPGVYGFTIYEDKIFAHKHDDIIVYDTRGNIIRNMFIKSPQDIVTLNNNIVIKTDERILMRNLTKYSTESFSASVLTVFV